MHSSVRRTRLATSIVDYESDRASHPIDLKDTARAFIGECAQIDIERPIANLGDRVDEGNCPGYDNMSRVRRRLQDPAQDFRVLCVVGVCARRGGNERRDLEPRISQMNVLHMDTLDLRNVPGKQIVRVTPGDDLRAGRLRMVLPEGLSF